MSWAPQKSRHKHFHPTHFVFLEVRWPAISLLHPSEVEVAVVSLVFVRMALGDAAAANAATSARSGRPSLPDYLPQENLAIALAAQKAAR